MSIFQEYVGINKGKDSDNLRHNDLTNGCGYYIIDNFIPIKELKKIFNDLLFIDTNQFSNKENNINSSEYGQIRSPFLSSESIRNLLCSEMILRLVNDHLVGNGICHLFNGQIVRRGSDHNQSLWHRDFNKVHISNPIMSFNTLFMLGEYLDINDFSTLQKKHSFELIPFSQLSYGPPTKSLLKEKKIISVFPGSILVFNSQLWHRVKSNSNEQLFLNIMFTEPFIKQQINLLGSTKEWIDKYSNSESDLARLLGWWARPPADLNEFRNPPDHVRTYRSGQG
ncbi:MULTISPECIES: hypothetical protein [Prochlorococcus]|uniref:Putative mmcH protein n=1 Tax=Prochlorococcus marinus str. MIT 9314 TaxID=167548 RepID=A0A0A2AIA8_PROMR|nr:hypothetical protein [Prochlorococcus marinus]KGG00265.1 putative mmcH protein [Prochlorococcus marinus str. MIT 9314]